MEDTLGNLIEKNLDNLSTFTEVMNKIQPPCLLLGQCSCMLLFGTRRSRCIIAISFLLAFCYETQYWHIVFYFVYTSMYMHVYYSNSYKLISV